VSVRAHEGRRIPVFVSCPSVLSAAQEKSLAVIHDELGRHDLEPRTLGRSDYPTDLPLREVYVLARHCSGGVILGFEQTYIEKGVRKRGTAGETTITPDASERVCSPWNQLEAGILFALGLPMVVFKEHGVSGGVFDPGVSDVFVHDIPSAEVSDERRQAVVAGVIAKWQNSVKGHYYRYPRWDAGDFRTW
jgi:hypothetical protein